MYLKVSHCKHYTKVFCLFSAPASITGCNNNNNKVNSFITKKSELCPDMNTPIYVGTSPTQEQQCLKPEYFVPLEWFTLKKSKTHILLAVKESHEAFLEHDPDCPSVTASHL